MHSASPPCFTTSNRLWTLIPTRKHAHNIRIKGNNIMSGVCIHMCLYTTQHVLYIFIKLCLTFTATYLECCTHTIWCGHYYWSVVTRYGQFYHNTLHVLHNFCCEYSWAVYIWTRWKGSLYITKSSLKKLFLVK